MNNPLNPEAINLPFNYSSIKNEFELLASASDTVTSDGTWVIIQANSVVLEQSDSGLSLPSGALPDWLTPQQTPLCIGIWRKKPLLAITVSSRLQLKTPYVAATFNTTDEHLDIQNLTLAGLAKQILHWERQSRHCSRCGAETEPIAATRGKICPSCGAEHFPHIHPCAIVLVKRGNELLLTRKTEWQPGRYSLVAGFLDMGESLEECAIREVREETGIEITNVRYVGSQNWPFPAQLMAGFVADYAGGEIVVDHNELEDARWFSIDSLPTLPPSRSIARWIIDNFKYPQGASFAGM
ncbi:MAG: NAD(+) diphosphatase [Desulfuromonadaceae bacterium]|nr:NAD(+) diphosphatase [Desulfuromonadaceae bacterium]